MPSRRIENARKIQESLKKSLRLAPLDVGSIKSICGVDVSYLKDRNNVFATAVVLTFPGLLPVMEVFEIHETDFPYIPGYLAFREVPAILKALHRLSVPIDLILVDGHGTAHPRRFGIASHLGVVAGIPTVGCAKKRLVGEFEAPSPEKGARTFLYHRDEKVGAVVRTRGGKKPVFVSPGHLTDIESAVHVTLAATGKFRIPEPVRQAHGLTVKIRKGFQEGKVNPRKG
ncbi:MAG: endonuclease V [Deltaproteobacteria bacterium]|nr:endonuclease V [Deltaproteobacteria bacterium]